MPKPIFLVGMPKTTPISEFMYIQKMLSESLPDYFSLVYFTNANEVDFKCFYEKDFDDIKFEELKQLVLSNIPAPSLRAEGEANCKQTAISNINRAKRAHER